jgi:hypothetical protein
VADFVHDQQASPTIEVRVYRHGVLVAETLCESEDEAAAVVDEWSEVDGVACEVDDLTFRHRPDDVFEPQLAVDLTSDDVPGVEYHARTRHRS